MNRAAPTWPLLLLALGLCASCGVPEDGPRPPVDPFGLAAEWPSGGPPRLWDRPLGPGYSGIVVEGERLYTMYREGDREVVTCLAAQTGETLWEHRYESRALEGQDTDYGEGPNAAPLLAGGWLYTIGFAGVMHCLDAASGEVRWSRDLWADPGGTVVELGYSASPVAHGETVLVVVGGPGRGIVALDQRDGRLVFSNLDFEASYATPSIMRLGGREQLVAFMATEVIGADPADGRLLWHYAIRNSYPQNICAPIRIDDDALFVSTPEAGSRGLRVDPELSRGVEELWSTTKVQCFYGRFAKVGEILYGTSGFQSGPRFCAIDLRSGKILWRSRGFSLSHVLAAGDRLILLDDEGKLTLASPAPRGLDVHSEASVLSAPALTPPTLSGTVLYARDQRRIVALSLGPTPP